MIKVIAVLILSFFLTNAYGSKVIHDEIHSHFYKLKFESINVQTITGEYWRSESKPSGYIDDYKQHIIFINQNGEVFKFPVDFKKIKDLAKYRLKSNLPDILLQQNYFSPRQGIKDILIDTKMAQIYVTVNFMHKKNCYGNEIFKANLNESYLNFQKFTDLKQCISKKTDFNPHLSGGRIILLNSKELLFTSGQMKDSLKLAQDKKSIFGKILLIDKATGKHSIYSMGHRNAQGLLKDKDGDIFTTEHGARGGDEINWVKREKNFGSPLTTYGTPYSYGDKASHITKLSARHNGPFEKPIFAFTPSIATSEIIRYEDDYFHHWNGDYFIASLKDKSLYRMRLNKQLKRVMYLEKIEIGSRIRDLIITEKNSMIVLFLESPEPRVMKLVKTRLQPEH